MPPPNVIRIAIACDRCGLLFSSGYAASARIEDATVLHQNSSTCPHCRHVVTFSGIARGGAFSFASASVINDLLKMPGDWRRNVADLVEAIQKSKAANDPKIVLSDPRWGWVGHLCHHAQIKWQVDPWTAIGILFTVLSLLQSTIAWRAPASGAPSIRVEDLVQLSNQRVAEQPETQSNFVSVQRNVPDQTPIHNPETKDGHD